MAAMVVLATGGILATAVAANAATNGHMVPMLADSHTGLIHVGNVSDKDAKKPSGGASSMVTVSVRHPAMTPTGFQTIDDPADLTFNQLLGINDGSRISGYFGSGADAKHPNKGYQVKPGYHRRDFTAENFPKSVQTQVVGINNAGTTVGFFVDANDANIGFVRVRNTFVAVANPATGAKPAFNQLLGVNNKGVAAGFYNDAAGASHGYLYWIQKRAFTAVTLPVAADSVVASGINDRGDVSGFYTVGKVTKGFVIRDHHFTSLSFGAQSNTQALGVNNADQVVGSFLDAAGKMHGFVWHAGAVKQVDNPHGTGGTLVNGINNRHQIVGFYVDAKGNTNGFLAKLKS
jgi:uncharacterized membrane protein